MELDSEKLLVDAIREAIRDGIKNKMTSGYNNPFDKLIESVLVKHGDTFRAMIGEALQSCFDNADFREGIKAGVRHTLAKTLIARFGGELEKQVNVLRSDPNTRARITLAIEEIVKSKTA
jgi:hypothetical protein